MAKAKQTYTKAGYDKLIGEYDYLVKVRREEILKDLSTAKAFGDLSENSEYDDARNEQAKVEARIKELENLIANAQIWDDTTANPDIIALGSHVSATFVDVDGSTEDVNYIIVGSNEVDPENGKISDRSTIGMKLHGLKKGAEVTIDTPAGEVKIIVKDVTRPEKAE